MQPIYLGLDTETCLIGPQELAPRFICVSLAEWDPDSQKFLADLLGNHPDDQAKEVIKGFLENPQVQFASQFAAYDWTVICTMWPDLEPLVWAEYFAGRIHCTICREKIINLSDTGRLKYKPMPDGSKTQIGYTLNDMGIEYGGVDRSALKEGDDIWRLNYSRLDGKRASEYPVEAAEYAKDDALECLRIFYAQNQRVVDAGAPVSLETSEFRAAVDFSLRWMSITGMKIDPVLKEKIEAELVEAYKSDNWEQLTSSGVLRPEELPRPHKRAGATVAFAEGMSIEDKRNILFGVWAAVEKPEDCELTTTGRIAVSAASAKRAVQAIQEASPQVQQDVRCETLMQYVKEPEAAGKMTKGKPASVCRAALQDLVRSLRQKAGLAVVYSNPNEPDESKLRVSCKEEVISDIVHMSPVLQAFQERENLKKLVTTEMPRMGYPDGRTADVVHFCYDVLKETTRTSSYAGGTKKDGTFLFPSGNGQNIDPRVRPCYVARPGWAILSIDYSSAELCISAQQQLNLFGHSKLAELINAGVDIHAFMAGQLAYNLDPAFSQSYHQSHEVYDMMLAYESFKAAEHSDDENLVAYFDHWRKLAKPVDLGYPGGLGAQTFISFAKGYGVHISLEQAKRMKEIWLEVLPEYQLGFDYINNQCKDPRWPSLGEGAHGKPIKGYCYDSAMGAHRAGCKYTSACNGIFLQTNSAEGGTLGVTEVMRACRDTSRPSPALGCRPLNFVHDEQLIEVPLDGYMHERAEYIGDLMVSSMKAICPDINIQVEKALALRWYKQAKPVYENGRLALWYPKEAV